MFLVKNSCIRIYNTTNGFVYSIRKHRPLCNGTSHSTYYYYYCIFLREFFPFSCPRPADATAIRGGKKPARQNVARRARHAKTRNGKKKKKRNGLHARPRCTNRYPQGSSSYTYNRVLFCV